MNSRMSQRCNIDENIIYHFLPLSLYIIYDTIHLRMLKSRRGGQLNVAHGTERKLLGKLNKNPSCSEETVEAIVREGSPKGSETTVVGFVKQLSFKPAVKKRGSYG